MSDLLAARSQMAVSLAFHIVFAMVGIAMPVLMVVAERRWQVTGQDVYLELARRWAKGTAILFAVGAVSGTVLSFELVAGRPVTVDPLAAMANPAALPQAVHMTLAAYAATGLGVAGIHAFLLLKDPSNAFHRRALVIALLVGGPAAVLQPVAGDFAARHVARHQPTKLAAAEALFETTAPAPLVLGGWPDVAARRTRGAIEIPYGPSLLAFHDPRAEVKGLDVVPRDEWPNVPIVHFAFQLMVALGTYMALVALWAGWRGWRGKDLAHDRRLMRALALTTPMGFIATEAGWVVTEVGRQPWVIYGVLKTADAVTPMPGLIVPFLTFTLLYCFLGAIVSWLLYRQIIRSPRVTE